MSTNIYEISTKTGAVTPLLVVELPPKEALEKYYADTFLEGAPYQPNPYIHEVEQSNIYYFKSGECVIYSSSLEDAAYATNN